MTTMTISTATEAKRSRNRRFKAVLAGGLVLGVGAAVTLAAWNDSEFAQGTFTAGSFNLEGSSTDGTTFTEHPTDDVGVPAALGFTVNPVNLSPGDSVSAPFAVRLDDATTNNASVSVLAGGTSGTVANLTYSLTQTATFDCTGAVDAILVPAGTAVGTVPTTTPFALAKGATVGDPGAPAYFCFTVTAGSGLVQAQTGTATWQFLATSQ